MSVSIIRRIAEIYLPLLEECVKDLAEHSEILEKGVGDILVRAGQYSDKVFFIAKGCVRAYYLKDGKDITDWFAFEDSFICSIVSYFTGVPSPHDIEVLEPSVLLQVNRATVERLSDQYPSFDRLEKISVTQTLLQLQQRVVSIQFETALQKYENLLRIRPDITRRVPLTHIASYLGITLETLSRIRNPKQQTK